MEKMWRERADYGHFFYRIPNGESAADAYDRVSGFNESLWRQFGEREFPSVLVLVTHGLMTRVFLMKWYHWSVEYFEDLRNVNHCEFVLMKMNPDSGKYILESQLRTWSELKRQRAAQAEQKAVQNPSRRNTLSAFLIQPPPPPPPPAVEKSPSMFAWSKPDRNETDDHPLARQEPASKEDTKEVSSHSPEASHLRPSVRSIPSYLVDGTSGSRTASGANTPHEMPSDDEGEQSSYFPDANTGTRSMATAMRKHPSRKTTPEDIERWVNESGMGRGKQADALGDEPTREGEGQDADGELPDQDGVGGYEEAMTESAGVEDDEREDRSLRGSVY